MYLLKITPDGKEPQPPFPLAWTIWLHSNFNDLVGEIQQNTNS